MNNYNRGVIVKDDGGVFLTWTRIRLMVVAIFFVILGIFLIILLATPECKCSLDDIQEADTEAFWGRCVDTAILRNESFNCDVVPAKNYRLPTNLQPRHYNVELHIDFYDDNPDNFTYAGHVEMFLECVEATDVITFHIGTQSTPNITIMNGNSSSVIRSQTYDVDTEMMRLILDEPILAGEQLILRIDFFDDKFTRGITLNSYWNNETSSLQYLVASHFQPHDARQAFPCFDEPIFKSTFNITLWRKEGYTALANMPLAFSQDMGDGWYKDYFEETPIPMSVYLVCFVISQYDYVADTADDGLTSKPLRYFADPDSVRKGYLNYAKSLGGRFFDWLEKTLDVPYALPKTDMVALNNYTSGGMENWGLIIFQHRLLVMNPEEHTLTMEERIGTTMAHELVHMWFGNLVTVKWWEDVWLQEGFAHFYARQVVVHVLPKLDYEDRSITRDYMITTRVDSSGSSHPLHNPVSTRAEALKAFSVISYTKGRCTVRMMRETIGHDTFEKAMKNYIDNMMYKNVDTQDLLSTIEQQLKTDGREIGTNFTEFMLTWIQQMGYPVVTFHRENGTSSSVEVTQNMYLQDDDTQLEEIYPSEYKYSWTVPITYMTSKDPSWQDPQRDWLVRDNRTVTSASMLAADDWLVGNVKLAGFYRVNYDQLGWEAIIKQLRADHTVFHTLNRAQFIEDAFSFIRSGLPPLKMVDAFRITEYLPHEMDYPPHLVLEHYIWGFEALLQDTPTFGYFRMYIERWIKPHYKRLGWDDSDGDTMTTKLFRKIAIKLACAVEMDDCVEEARRRYEEYETQNTSSRLAPDLVNGARCMAILRGNEADWERLFNKYLDGDEEDAYVALACTDKPWLISRYLELFMSHPESKPSQKTDDLSQGLRAFARNPIARPKIWSLMTEQQWAPWMEEHRVPILNTLAGYASTEDSLAKTVDVLKRGDVDLSEDTERLSQMIKNNIRWREEHLEELTSWFKQIVLHQAAV